MPSYSRDRHDAVPFLHIDSPPQTPWRTKAKDFQRRSSFVKRIALLAILLAFAVPIWFLTYRGQEDVADVQNRPTAPSPAVHAQWPQTPHRHPVVPKPQASSDTDTADGSLSPAPAVEPVTFSLLMWSENSAQEGVILIKVRISSLLTRHV